MKRMLAFLIGCFLLAPGPGSLAADVDMGVAGAGAAGVLMEPQTQTRLFDGGADEKRSVAGLAKLPAILTLAQAFDEGAAEESASMRVSDRAAGVGGPTAFLDRGETIRGEELIKSAVMISAGDAIIALGENIYGSEQVFTENINVTLRQLGLSVTAQDPLGTGLTFSPWELACMGRGAMESGVFMRYAALYLDSITHEDGRETELVNANRLLKNYGGCTGLLTGSSPEDGYCGIFSTERNGTSLIAVVTGADSAVKRTALAVDLLDYGYAAFRVETLAKAGEVVAGDVPVREGDVKTVNLIAKDTKRLVVEQQQGRLTATKTTPAILEAPLSREEAVGELAWTDGDGKLIGTIPLYPDVDVAPFGIKDIFLRIAGLFVG